MDSKPVAEEHCNTETEEGTIAVEKKRSRRVSFAAEMTSIHVFDRDEEYETPPESKPSSSDNPAELGHYSDDLGFRPESPDTNDSKEYSQNEEEDDDDDELDSKRLFLRPFESPSPGSNIGSANSNDEDNFFGPVSASFIRPGQLSDSAASDDNHDVTMDSTAFSMHFRSLARSESGGDLKTSTGVHLSFEEKTPTQDSIPTNLGSSMVPTVAKKPNCQSSVPISKLSCGSDSNDMSLVGENPHRYDYARLSPGLDALLAEGSKDLHAVTISDNISASKAPRNMESKLSPLKDHGGGLMDLSDDGDKETGEVKLSPLKDHGGGLMDLSDDGDKETGEVNTHDMVVSVVHNKLGEVNDSSKTSPVSQIPHGFSSNTYVAPASDALSTNQLTGGMPVGKSKEYVKDASQKSLDFSAGSCGTLSNLDNNVNQLDEFAQREFRSPTAGFISSPFTRQRQVLLDSASPSKTTQIMTPPKKQAGSSVRNESIINDENASSIQRSISKLKMLEASPFSSTRDAKIDNSNLRSLDYLLRTPPLGIVLEKISKGPQGKHVDDNGIEIPPLGTFSKQKFSSVAQKKGRQGSVINMDDNRIETPKGIGNVRRTEEFTSLVKGGRYLHHVSAEILCADQPNKLGTAAALPSQFTWSGKKTQPNLLTSEDPSDGTLVASGTDSSLADITRDIVTPHKFISSPEKRLEMGLLTSPEFQGSLSLNLRQHLQYNKLVNFGPDEDATSRQSVISASFSTTTDDKLDSLFMETRAQSSSPFVEINHFKDLTEIEKMEDREVNLHDIREKSGTLGNFLTPSSDKDSENFQSIIPDGNFQTGRDLARYKNDLPRGGIKAISHCSTSPSAHGSADESSLQKNLVAWFTQSPTRKEICNATENDNIHSLVVEGVLSPKSNQLTNQFKNSSARKRRNEEIILQDTVHVNDTARNQRSPKLLKGGVCDSEFSDRRSESNSVTCMNGHKLKHWDDIYSKLSGDIKQVFSPSTDKLTLWATDALEDILVHQQRSKTYEMLCNEIQSQKSFDPLSSLQQKRVAEARFLLHRIVHGQAKLQLMHVKRDRLLKKAQLLSSEIQESQMLKLNYFPRLSGDVQVDGGHPRPFEDIQKGQVACDNFTAIGQALEASERRITNLTKSFHTSCKVKGEPGCADTLVLVNDHLTKRTCCRFIRLESQLWVVDKLESGNGHHIVVLNYLGFITQRLTVTVGPVSSISIANKLNSVNIAKNLPDMDACSAFSFVLNAETTRKYVGPKSLSQETQITSSLLGNLLDVAEEVHLARIELQNLTQTSFRSSSVEQLDLQLCFFDFKSGRKATLTLDMSCLKRGVYPSEILPSQMEAPADGTQNSLSQPFLAEIRAAVQSLRAGYLRIIRLCRCISQVIQASSG